MYYVRTASAECARFYPVRALQRRGESRAVNGCRDHYGARLLTLSGIRANYASPAAGFSRGTLSRRCRSCDRGWLACAKMGLRLCAMTLAALVAGCSAATIQTV